LLILAINSSASSGVLFLKTQRAQLSRYVLDSTVSPLYNISRSSFLAKGFVGRALIKEQNLAHDSGNFSPSTFSKSKIFYKAA
jgi:hypothetical protein